MVVALSYAGGSRPADPGRARRLARLRWLAVLIDGAFVLPGTRFRFGLNSVVGLLPVGGDAVLALISLYILNEARVLGVPNRILLRMLANVAVEFVGGSVPLLGDAFDVVFKANLRNLALIDRHLGSPTTRV